MSRLLALFLCSTILPAAHAFDCSEPLSRPSETREEDRSFTATGTRRPAAASIRKFLREWRLELSLTVMAASAAHISPEQGRPIAVGILAYVAWRGWTRWRDHRASRSQRAWDATLSPSDPPTSPDARPPSGASEIFSRMLTPAGEGPFEGFLVTSPELPGPVSKNLLQRAALRETLMADPDLARFAKASWWPLVLRARNQGRNSLRRGREVDVSSVEQASLPIDAARSSLAQGVESNDQGSDLLLLVYSPFVHSDEAATHSEDQGIKADEASEVAFEVSESEPEKSIDPKLLPASPWINVPSTWPSGRQGAGVGGFSSKRTLTLTTESGTGVVATIDLHGGESDGGSAGDQASHLEFESEGVAFARDFPGKAPSTEPPVRLLTWKPGFRNLVPSWSGAEVLFALVEKSERPEAPGREAEPRIRDVEEPDVDASIRLSRRDPSAVPSDPGHVNRRLGLKTIPFGVTFIAGLLSLAIFDPKFDARSVAAADIDKVSRPVNFWFAHSDDHKTTTGSIREITHDLQDAPVFEIFDWRHMPRSYRNPMPAAHFRTPSSIMFFAKSSETQRERPERLAEPVFERPSIIVKSKTAKRRAIHARKVTKAKAKVRRR